MTVSFTNFGATPGYGFVNFIGRAKCVAHRRGIDEAEMNSLGFRSRRRFFCTRTVPLERPNHFILIPGVSSLRLRNRPANCCSRPAVKTGFPPGATGLPVCISKPRNLYFSIAASVALQDSVSHQSVGKTVLSLELQGVVMGNTGKPVAPSRIPRASKNSPSKDFQI
jgi:hypothetical protein